jgi:hypothetical protein
MAAFQLDNQLIPLQWPVQLRQAEPNACRVSCYFWGALLDCSHVTGCCRWLPQATTKDTCGAGTVPGLLVFQLTSRTTAQQGQEGVHHNQSTTGQPCEHGAVRSCNTSAPGAHKDAAPPQLHEKGKRKCSELSQPQLDTGRGRRMPPVRACRQRSKPPVNYSGPVTKRVRTGAGPRPAATKAPPSKAHAAPKAAAPTSHLSLSQEPIS